MMLILAALCDAMGVAAGLVLVYAVTTKVRDVRGFIRGVGDYRVVPDQLVTATALSVIIIELIGGVGLVVGQQPIVVSALSLSLLAAFGIAVSLSLARGRDLACHCFGSTSDERVTPVTLGRIAVLGIAVTASGCARLVQEDLALHAVEQLPLRVLLGLFLLALTAWIAALPQLVRPWRAILATRGTHSTMNGRHSR